MLFDTAHPPQYNPPYENATDDLFARHFLRYAAAGISFEPQHGMQTLCGDFIIDFLVVDHEGRHIGIECDGKESHDLSRDEWRDGMILGEKHLDAIYRFRGQDLHYAWEDVMYFLFSMEPTIFATNAPLNLEVLISEEVRESTQDRYREFYSFRYPQECKIPCDFLSIARRRDLPGDRRNFWQTAYHFAASIGGGPLDEVIHRFRMTAATFDNSHS
ncbi:hypothetical protein [Comamonas sp. MYb396]|uniref:hypothetical protein n=1 Tax=Comamonas sp. MYb396 TaxID=2745302 RepID=UPI0030AB611C